MKKTMIMVAALCMLGQASSAQVMFDNVVTVEYKDAEGKMQTMEKRSSDGLVDFSFLGSKKEVTNGEAGSDEHYAAMEENADAYVYESNYISDERSWRALGLYAHVSVPGEAWGICVSTSQAPTISEHVPYGYEETEYRCEGLTDFTIYCTNGGSDCRFYLNRLDYHSTYYVRPFVKFSNGEIMYGGEKAFTTPYTFVGVEANEPEGKEWHGVYGDVFLTKSALAPLVDEEYADSWNVQQAMVEEVRKRMSVELEETLRKSAYRKIDCAEGTMHFVNKLPDYFVEAFRAEMNPYSMEPVEIVTDASSVNFDLDSWGDYEFTKSVVTPMATYVCDESLGVPNNRFLYLQPINSNANPIVAFNIPQYLWGREYSIYAVFVHCDVRDKLEGESDADDMRPYRFYTNIFERNDRGEYKNSTWLTNPADGTRFFVTNPENFVDTLYIGDYAFSLNPGGMIQIQSRVTSRQLQDYSRDILISKIILVPKDNKEEASKDEEEK